MFTGIVEEIGKVVQVITGSNAYHLVIQGQAVLEGTKLGDSIAVNGVCLTVTNLTSSTFTAGVSPETRRRTNLEQLREGSSVNLERSVTPSTRMGGHFVQGHIDDTGKIINMRREQDSLWVTIQVDQNLLGYIVEKGYIALDGTSLTVVEVRENSFSVMLVAYTQSHITLPSKSIGNLINVEVDILGKYVEKLLQKSQKKQNLMDLLTQNGYV